MCIFLGCKSTLLMRAYSFKVNLTGGNNVTVNVVVH